MKIFIVLTHFMCLCAFTQTTAVTCEGLLVLKESYLIDSNKINFVKKQHLSQFEIQPCEYEFFQTLDIFAAEAYERLEYDLFGELAKLQWGFSSNRNSTQFTSESASNMGSYFLVKSVYDSAYFYFREASEGYKILGDSLNVGANLLSMSIVRLNIGSFYESQKLSTEALVFLETESNENKTHLLSIYNNLGISSNELGQYNNAINWYKKALALSSEQIEQLVLLNNIGVVLRNKKSYQHALEHFQKARDVLQTNDFPAYRAMVDDNIAYTRFLLGNLSVENDLQEAYRKREKENSKLGMTVSLLHLAEFNYFIEQKDSSRIYALKSYNIARTIGDTKNQRKALRFILKHWPQEMWVNQYLKLEDELDSIDRALEHKFALIDYQAQKKEKENLNLKSNNAKHLQHIAESDAKMTFLYAVVTSLILVITLILVYLHQRKKIRRKNLMIERLKEREAERDTISLHIHEVVASDLLLAIQKGEAILQNEYDHKVSDILFLTERAYTGIRKISQELHPPDFTKTPFVQHIRYMIAEYTIEGKLSIISNDLSVLDVQRIDTTIKREILAILKEVFTNIRKHANANCAELSINIVNDQLKIIVRDNGKGMSPKVSSGVGIEHLHKRIKNLNGYLVIGQTEGAKGTTVTFEIPIKK